MRVSFKFSLVQHRAEQPSMLKRTASPSALVGMTVCLILFITGLTMRRSKMGFADGSSAQPRGTEWTAAQAGSQKVLTKAAPRISLAESSTNLRDIQNATLGVCLSFDSIFHLKIALMNFSFRKFSFFPCQIAATKETHLLFRHTFLGWSSSSSMV